MAEERSFGGYAFFTTYATSDGRHVAMGAVERKFVTNMLTALGAGPISWRRPAAPPAPGQAPVKAFLGGTFATRTRAEWEAFFAGLDVCAAPVLDLHEAFHGAQAQARQMLVRDGAGNLHIGIPIKYAEEPGRLDPAVPALGADTAEILGELGFTGAQIAAASGA